MLGPPLSLILSLSLPLPPSLPLSNLYATWAGRGGGDRDDEEAAIRMTRHWHAHAQVFTATRRPASFSDWNVVYAVPVAPGRCRLFVRVVFEVAPFVTPDTHRHACSCASSSRSRFTELALPIR